MVVAALEPVQRLMKRLSKYGAKCSESFTSWHKYFTDYSQLLFDYIAAKRSDNHKMLIETFVDMLPLDFMFGHKNYARWGTVNVIERQFLADECHEVYRALADGNWSVHHTKPPFDGIWHDMEIEQSIKKKCGFIIYSGLGWI